LIVTLACIEPGTDFDAERPDFLGDRTGAANAACWTVCMTSDFLIPQVCACGRPVQAGFFGHSQTDLTAVAATTILEPNNRRGRMYLARLRASELRFRGLTFMQERFPVSCLNSRCCVELRCHE
jgi:hypothetical protein